MSFTLSAQKAASWLYGLVTRFRNLLYDRRFLPVYRCRLLVICVGNITAGGNSKTPLCIYIARKLKDSGHAPVILSRGYGGKTPGPLQVDVNSRILEVGDEPLMLVRSHDLKVVVAKDRVAGARFIEEKKLGDVIILDDGFQHRRLHRDLNFVTVDVSTDEAIQAFLAGRLLPFGRFREDRVPAMRRADGVFFSARQPRKTALALPPELLSTVPGGLPQFRSFTEPLGIHSLSDASNFQGGQVVAFCSIANPDGFFRTLSAMGIELKHTRAFPDHYIPTSADLQELRTTCPGLALICTEKDAVKLPPGGSSGVYVLRTELQLEGKDRLASLLSGLWGAGKAS